LKESAKKKDLVYDGILNAPLLERLILIFDLRNSKIVEKSQIKKKV
jgi:hypothetical protein